MQQTFQCYRCSAQNYVGQPHCWNCHLKFQYNCPNCQAPVEGMTVNCPYCRIVLPWPTQQQKVPLTVGNNITSKKARNIQGSSTQEVTPEKNNFLKGFLGCGGAIVLLFLGIAWAMASEMKGNLNLAILGPILGLVGICLGIWGIARFFRR